LVQTHAKIRNFALLGVVLLIAVIAVGANSNIVAAQAQPCATVLSYPIMPATYSYSNVPIIVPLSASCTTTFGNTIYVSGNAYDVTSNVGLGTVNSVLQSTDGGNTFNGQLGFNLPPTAQGHTVTISVSLYANQYGSLISANSETFQAITGNQQIDQVATTTVTQPIPVPVQSTSPTTYPTQTPLVQQPLQQHAYRHQSQYQIGRNNSLLDYVAIVAILVAVIIATAGLIAYGRRRQQPPAIAWVPAPPLPP